MAALWWWFPIHFSFLVIFFFFFLCWMAAWHLDKFRWLWLRVSVGMCDRNLSVMFISVAPTTMGLSFSRLLFVGLEGGPLSLIRVLSLCVVYFFNRLKRWNVWYNLTIIAYVFSYKDLVIVCFTEGKRRGIALFTSTYEFCLW